ncbi:FAD-dependent oxidoreductase [Halospeciosus flavus]|uniref:Glycerol-3-phosphate dehydrogenase n=1 Tax=Halospeciosus flavus TaxID=3032283 RepID=A0ABD5Z3L0_9EURY|nr:FAD-dependent oxidoreductase [Halospeciosus flavus]
MERTDVLVVGGGATGVGVARDLAMRGVDVTLVERGGLNAGTSGHSHGVLHSGARYADDDPEGARECIEENRILRDIAGECVADTGGYFVQTSDDSAYFETKRDACRDLDIPVDVIDGDTARETEPRLADDVERVFRVPDGVVYPSRLVAANAADAREHGATIHVDAPVTDVLVSNGAVVGASVDHPVGSIEADHVVNATGAWAGELAAMVDVDIEMTPTKGAMAVVDLPSLRTVLNRCRPASDGDIVVPHPDAGTAILGTTSVEVDDPDDFPTSEAEVEDVFVECAAMLDTLPREALERVYWGVRPLYTPERYGEDARGISRGFYLLDHADRDGLGGFSTIVGGKLTTYRRMAEATADHVCERLGVDAACRTAEEPLVHHDDLDTLDGLVREFDAGGPADADVVGSE